MFEDRTRESIKAEMLAEVNPSSGLSTLEGGFLDQVFGPASVELEKVYAAMNTVFCLFAIDETCGGLIDIAAENYSIERKDGVSATATIHFVGASGAHIPAGTVFSTADGLIYSLRDAVTLTASGQGDGLLVAEDVGSRYNVADGKIDRIYDNLSGLEYFSVGEATGGIDEESDAALVGRYYDKLQRPVTSGNPNHYRQWAMEVAGVGEAKVISLINGPGTVGVTLVSENFGPVDNAVVSKTVEHIEAVRPVGISVAPAVKSAEALPINVTVVSKLNTTVTEKSVAVAFRARLEEYLRSLVEDKYSKTYEKIADDKDYTVSYNRVATILMTTPGVVDYTSLTINGGKVDVTIGKDQVPAAGEVTVT